MPGTPSAVGSAAFVSALAFLAPVASFAQAPGGQNTAPWYVNVFPLVVVFLIMYFLMIRPQAARAKQHQDFLAKLKRGDEVVTGGGLIGRVEGLTDRVVTLDIGDGVRVKVLRQQITGALTAAVASGAEVKA